MNVLPNAHCWAEVDLDALLHNFRLIQRLAGETPVCAVVKADAYGHGDRMVSRTLVEAGAAWFAVSCLSEAKQLRRAGIRRPILILGMTQPAQAAELAEAHIVQALFSLDYARALAAAARVAGVTVEAHLKADTGMGRIGFGLRENFETAVGELAACRKLPGLRVTGIFQHFAAADSLSPQDRAYTEAQHALFCRTLARLETEGGPLETVHCCNSAGLIAHPEWGGNLVRAGIILYGQDPSEALGLPGLRPVMRLKSVVSHVKELPPGEDIGYGRTFTTQGPTRIATLCCGYADGYPRALSNRGVASIDGRPAPVVGRVSMDQVMVDVTELPPVSMGDEAVLIGGDGADSFASAAGKAGTISYELLCAVSRRVPRVYLREGRAPVVEDYLADG